MNVLLLTRYTRLGASSRIRFYQYLPKLEPYGINVTEAPLFDDRYLHNLYAGRRPGFSALPGYYARRLRTLLAARRYDLVWLQNEIFPWLPFGEMILRLSGVPYLVDYDDAIFHRYDRHRHSWVRRLLGGKIDRIMHGAAAVSAGNPYIAERAREAGARRVELIPSVIDQDRYRPRPPQLGEGPVTIGWIGTPVTTAYLEQVAPALRSASMQRPLRLLTIGAGTMNVDGIEVVNHPWSEDTEGDLIRSMDIGIMPLPDAAWARGKCGYKLIQYMACGVPVIASPVGVNRDLAVPGKTGLLATTQAEWTAALLQLAGDTALRETLGRGARSLVEERFCLKRTLPIVAALLQQTARQREGT